MQGEQSTPGATSSQHPSMATRGDSKDRPVIELYGILFAKFNQEGDGYWRRFNIMIGINLALFGAVGETPEHFREYLKMEIVKWDRLGRAAGLRGDQQKTR